MSLRHALAVLAVGAGLSALAGCGEGGGDLAAAPSKLVSPEAFAAAVAEPERVTINVHVPDEGSIPGTDLAIPFDQIAARKSELPALTTPLAVYCRSGRMSAIAVQELADLGFSDVVELDGGMVGWEAAGRPLLPPPAG